MACGKWVGVAQGQPQEGHWDSFSSPVTQSTVLVFSSNGHTFGLVYTTNKCKSSPPDPNLSGSIQTYAFKASVLIFLSLSFSFLPCAGSCHIAQHDLEGEVPRTPTASACRVFSSPWGVLSFKALDGTQSSSPCASLSLPHRLLTRKPPENREDGAMKRLTQNRPSPVSCWYIRYSF